MKMTDFKDGQYFSEWFEIERDSDNVPIWARVVSEVRTDEIEPEAYYEFSFDQKNVVAKSYEQSEIDALNDVYCQLFPC